MERFRLNLDISSDCRNKLFLMCNIVVLLSLASFAFAGDIKDVRPPVNMPLNIFFVIVIAILTLSLIIGIIWLWYKRKHKTKKTSKEEEIVKNPWEIAFEELERLKEDGLIVKGRYKEYYSRLSDIVRGYFERRFRIRAPEMTTEEFLISLKDCNFLKEFQKDTLKQFLHASDMVKFAKYSPTVSEAEDSFVLANRLIKETIPSEKLGDLNKEERHGI